MEYLQFPMRGALPPIKYYCGGFRPLFLSFLTVYLHYAEYLHNGRSVLLWSHSYGSSPVGSSISLYTNTVYPSPKDWSIQTFM